MTYGKTNKSNKAPKVKNPSPNKPYMKEGGMGMKKSGALPARQKRLSK